MADLTIFPQAYINRRLVTYSWREHLIEAQVTMAEPSGLSGISKVVYFTAAATNPERALADLRTKVEVWEDSLRTGAAPKLLCPSEC